MVRQQGHGGLRRVGEFLPDPESWLERHDESVDDAGPVECPTHGTRWWPEHEDGCPVCAEEATDDAA